MSNQAKARRIAVLGTRAVGKFLLKESEYIYSLYTMYILEMRFHLKNKINKCRQVFACYSVL